MEDSKPAPEVSSSLNDDVLRIIFGFVADVTKNNDDLVISIDPKPNQPGKYLKRFDFSTTLLFATKHTRKLYLEVLKTKNITLSLRTTTAAYDLAQTLPRELLEGTQRLIQEVPLAVEAVNDVARISKAVREGKSSFSINSTELPNLKALFVTFIRSPENYTFIPINYSDSHEDNKAIAQTMSNRILTTWGPWMTASLRNLLFNRPATPSVWSPTMIIDPDLNLYPTASHPMSFPFAKRDNSKTQVVLVSDSTANNGAWAVRRTVDLNKLPGSLPTDDLTSLYVRLALVPLLARGERIKVFFLLGGDLEERAGTGRLCVFLRANYSLGRTFGSGGKEKAGLKIGRLVTGATMKEQGVKEGEEFEVTFGQ